MRKRLLGMAAWGFLVCASVTLAAPNIIVGGVHASRLVPIAVDAVLGSTGCGGSSCVSNPIFIDANQNDPYFFTMPNAATPPATVCNVADGQTSDACSGLVANHAPYVVVSSAYCCQWIQAPHYADYWDYATSVTNGMIHSIPLAEYAAPGITPPTGLAPPASTAMTTQGPSDWGIEFSFAASADHSLPICTVNGGCWQLCSGDTCKVTIGPDSTITSYMAGILAAARYKQPTWNWFDIKGALRQTAVVCSNTAASQWTLGYDHTKYGYGCIQWDKAIGLSGTSAIFLQPPAMQAIPNNSTVFVTLYAARSTRRNHEVVYSCTTGYSWPIKNEYALADVTAGCSTVVYTSNGTDVVPSFAFGPATSGTYTLVAFTTDGSGAYSRVEQFGPQTFTLTEAPACTTH